MRVSLGLVINPDSFQELAVGKSKDARPVAPPSPPLPGVAAAVRVYICTIAVGAAGRAPVALIPVNKAWPFDSVKKKRGGGGGNGGTREAAACVSSRVESSLPGAVGVSHLYKRPHNWVAVLGRGNSATVSDDVGGHAVLYARKPILLLFFFFPVFFSLQHPK